jgi:ABC-2 type transport system permease protein
MILGAVNFGKITVRVGILGPETGFMDIAGKDEIYRLLDRSEGIRYAPADPDTLNTDLMTGRFQVVLDYRESETAESFELLSYQNEEKTAFLKAMLQEAFSKQEPVKLTGLKPQGLSATERSIAMLFTMFLIFSTVHASMLIRDRQNGIISRYSFARKSSTSYAAGFFLQNLVLTFLQLLLCMAALLLIQKDFLLTAKELLLCSVIMAFISSSFAILICLGSRSEVQSNIAASSLAAVMSLLGGTFVAVEAMPGLLRILSYASPVRWAVELLRIL